MSKQAAYVKRDELLFAMGYRSYADYLRSGAWKMVRKAVFSVRATCEACGKTATEVHHRRYTQDNLTGKSTDGLVAICRDCHEKIEFNKDRKRTIEAANAVLDGLIEKRPAIIPTVVKKAGKRARCCRCGAETGSKAKMYCENCVTVVFAKKKPKQKKQPTTTVFKPKPVQETRKRCQACDAIMAKASSFKVCLKCREAKRENRINKADGLAEPATVHLSGQPFEPRPSAAKLQSLRADDGRELALCVTWDSRNGQGWLDR